MADQLMEYEAWLAPALAWLEAQLSEAGWHQARAGFLAQLRIDDGSLATQPALQALIHSADAADSDDDVRALLLDADARAQVLGPRLVQADAGAAAVSAADTGTDPELQFVEGVGWMRYDEASGEWVAAEGAAEPARADGAADDLDWVTAEQAGQLEERLGAEWRSTTVAQLGERWGEGWQTNPAEHKRAWLDGLIPSLVMPFADVKVIGELFGPAVISVEQDYAAEFAETFKVDPEALGELIDEMGAEFYFEVLQEVAARAGNQSS